MGARALVKTPKFLSQVQESSHQAPRLIEAVAGAEWVILRSPDQGMVVPGTRFRSWPVHPEAGVSFKIVYSFDDRQVVFQGLWVVVPPSDR
jgi:hypothetical protein